MNAAAVAVCREVGPDIVVAYGVSDEYSFVLSKGCELFERRARSVFWLIHSFIDSSCPVMLDASVYQQVQYECLTYKKKKKRN